MKGHNPSQSGESAGAKAGGRAALSNRILVVDDNTDLRRSMADLLIRLKAPYDSSVADELIAQLKAKGQWIE